MIHSPRHPVLWYTLYHERRREHLSVWKNAEAEQHFRTTRRRVLARSCSARISQNHSTSRRSTGPTHVYRWAGEGEPLVFLHGVARHVDASWSDYIDRLRRQNRLCDRHHRRRRPQPCNRVPVTDANDLAEWLDETLDGLGIDHAHLAWFVVRRLPRRPQPSDPVRKPPACARSRSSIRSPSFRSSSGLSCGGVAR